MKRFKETAKRISEHPGWVLSAIFLVGGSAVSYWLFFAWQWRTAGIATLTAILQGCLDVLAPLQGYPALTIAILLGGLLIVGAGVAGVRTAQRLNVDHLFGPRGYAILDCLTVSDKTLDRVTAHIEKKLGRTLPVSLVKSDKPVCLVYGLIKPRIVISTHVLRELNEEELEAALLHEADHLVRRDPLRRVTAETVADLLFFIPLVRNLTRHLSYAQELEADRFASRQTGKPEILASAVLKLATQSDIGLASALSRAWLPDRVRRLLDLPAEKPRRRFSLAAAAISVVMLAGLFAAPYALASDRVVKGHSNACFKECVAKGTHSTIQECLKDCGHEKRAR
ncbi:MAG: M56 family metallopeptidase [Actinomycetota bacterium]